MKQNIFQRLKAAFSPVPVNPINFPKSSLNTTVMRLNEGITIYPFGEDQTFIENGYQKNWAVYVVVRKLVKIFSQIPWYHYKIATSERKAYFDEYIPLSKTHLHDKKAREEMAKILKKSVEQVAVTSELSRFLAKPNRNQNGNRFRGNMFGHKLLTGEGNTWFSSLNQDPNDKPTEMFVIPKNNLGLVKGGDPWAIASYNILLSGGYIPTPKDNVMMWIEEGYGLDPVTLQHLRGFSPLEAYKLGMQGTNLAAETLARMNKNQGVSAIAFNESMTATPTPQQAAFMHQQFDGLINDRDRAGQMAVLNGKWGFHQVGLDARALQLIDQQDKGLDTVCMIYDLPVGAFKHGTTYENKTQETKDVVYNAIAPHAFDLRDQWNDVLLKKFSLDRERDAIDCDIIALPQLADDLKTQAETLAKLWQLTPNQVLQYIGYDPSPDPNMDKIYIPSSLTPLDQLNSDPGGNLDAQMNLLGQ